MEKEITIQLVLYKKFTITKKITIEEREKKKTEAFLITASNFF